MRGVLGAAASGVLVVTLVVVRRYLDWAYVGNRLLSATVECECVIWILCFFCAQNVFDKMHEWNRKTEDVNFGNELTEDLIVDEILFLITDEETGWYDRHVIE